LLINQLMKITSTTTTVYNQKTGRLVKSLLFFTVISSYISTELFSINLGFMQISLFRIAIFLLPFMCCAKMISNYENKGYFLENKIKGYSITFMSFWLFYAMLSSLWSPDFYDTLRHTYFIFCGVICIIALSLLTEDLRDILNCLTAAVIMILVHGIIGWREVFTGNYVVETEYTLEYALQMLPVSSMFNVNDYATCMTVGVFFSYALWKTSYNRFISAFAFVVMINSVLLVVWSRSRANIYGLLLAMLVLLILSGKKIFVNLFIVFVSLISAVFVVNLLCPWIMELVTDVVFPGITGIDLESGSDYIRANLIKNGLHFLPQNLFMGTGAGGIEHWMSTEWIYDTGGIINIHNWWMEILTGYGIIVFTGYLFFYIKLLTDMYRTYRTSKNKTEVYIAISMIGALTSFIIGSVSSSSNISSYSVWSFFAIAIAYQGMLIKNNVSRNEVL